MSECLFTIRGALRGGGGTAMAVCREAGCEWAAEAASVTSAEMFDIITDALEQHAHDAHGCEGP